MIDKAIEFAKEIFARDTTGHDFYHTMRVYRTAIQIAWAEGADQQIVALSALLHDVDDRKLSPETCEGKDRAKAFLHRNGVGREQEDRIIQIISEVSFSAGCGTPSTLEGRCVQDADRLDAIGAIGVARAFAYGGSRGRAMYDPEGNDDTTTIAHFYQKLLLLKDLMTTVTGRNLAEKRDAYLRDFLQEFLEEWETAN